LVQKYGRFSGWVKTVLRVNKFMFFAPVGELMHYCSTPKCTTKTKYWNLCKNFTQKLFFSHRVV